MARKTNRAARPATAEDLAWLAVERRAKQLTKNLQCKEKTKHPVKLKLTGEVAGARVEAGLCGVLSIGGPGVSTSSVLPDLEPLAAHLLLAIPEGERERTMQRLERAMQKKGALPRISKAALAAGADFVGRLRTTKSRTSKPSISFKSGLAEEEACD